MVLNTWMRPLERMLSSFPPKCEPEPFNDVFFHAFVLISVSINTDWGQSASLWIHTQISQDGWNLLILSDWTMQIAKYSPAVEFSGRALGACWGKTICCEVWEERIEPSCSQRPGFPSPSLPRQRFEEINALALAVIQAEDWINYRLLLGRGAVTWSSIEMPPTSHIPQ